MAKRKMEMLFVRGDGVILVRRFLSYIVHYSSLTPRGYNIGISWAWWEMMICSGFFLSFVPPSFLPREQGSPLGEAQNRDQIRIRAIDVSLR